MPVHEGTTSVNLGAGVSVSGFASTFGLFGLQIEVKEPEKGYRATDAMTFVTVNASQELGSYQIAYAAPSSDSVPRRVLVRDNSNGSCGFQEIAAAPNGGTFVVGAHASSPTAIGLAVREYDYLIRAGRVRFMSNESGVSADELVSGPELEQAVNVFRAGGLAVGGPSVRISPTGQSFDPPGLVKYCYDQSELFNSGLGEAGLRFYQFNELGQRDYLAEQEINQAADYMTARVPSLSSIFGVFGATTPVPASDLLPPRTELGFDVAFSTAAGVFHVAAPARVLFSALDPPFPDAPVSGVAETRYALDPPSSNPLETLPYSTPVALSVGTHTVYYFSRDAAGNSEVTRISTVVVSLAAVKAYALAADAEGKLWEVLSENGQFVLGQFDGASRLTTTILPGGLDAFWSIAFAQGNAYAVGTAEAPGGAQVAVYRVASDGVLLSSAVFASGGDKSDFALDAAGEVWVAGATQDPGGHTKLALWRYCPHVGSLRLKGSYERGGGFDAGFGVAVDSGTLWVAGYSRGSPTGPLDLALWKFDAEGALLSGPYLRHGYLNDSEEALARIKSDEEGLAVAAGRQEGGGPREAAFIRFDRSGAVVSERTWRSNDGRGAYIGGLSAGENGYVVVGTIGDSPEQRLAIWSYTPDGALSAAAGQVSLTHAAGATYTGGRLWLAVDGIPTPYDGFQGVALSGQDIFLSSAAPPAPALAAIVVLPGMKELAAGATYQFSAVGTFTDGSTRTLSWTGWSPIAPMPAARGSMASAGLDGRLHAIGGWDQSFTPQAEHFVYEPADNSWSNRAPLPQPRSGADAVVVDGRLYLLGGFRGGPVTADLLMYDPAADAWTQLASMPAPRTNMFTGTLEGKIYVAGGNTGGGYGDQLWVYDPALDTWAVKASMPQPQAAGFAGSLGGMFFVFAGLNDGGPTSAGWGYDPVTDSWSAAAPIPTWRYIGASSVKGIAAVWEDRLFAVGGLPQGATPDTPGFKVVEIYDPVADVWTTGPDSILGHYGGAAAAAIEGTLYLAGGGEGHQTSAFAEGLGGGDVVWSTDAPDIATTTPGGFVTALAAGAARVSASTGVVSGFAALTVHATYFVAAAADGGASIGSTFADEVITPVSTSAAATAYAAAVETQGFVLASPALYEITPSPVVFDPPALLSMTFDPTGIDTMTVALYRYNDPLWSSAAITGQTVTVLEPTLARVSGYLSSASLYAAFAKPGIGPPTVLRYPAPGAIEAERSVGGVVPVTGVIGETAASWTLSVGSAVVASGAGAASGVLAQWDTAGLTGPQTLTLSSTDGSGNTTTTAAVVSVGAPVFERSVGKQDADAVVSILEGPTGIAVRGDGLVWVAKTGDADGLLLLGGDGAVHAQVGGLKKPEGLALDVSGDVFVADSGNDRVVKLSPDGASVLLSIGRLDHHGKPKAGSGPGEFRNPRDVALDVNGDFYVADTGNRRIQVFDGTGAFLREFGQGVFPEDAEIQGVALAADGVWVADKASSAVFLCSRNGALIRTVDDADSVVGEIARTRGLATDRFGALYVVEPSRDRVQKFAPGGRGMLAFGPRSQATPAEKAAKRFLTGPVDAALAPDGALWVSDRARDRIVRYALPASFSFGVAAYNAGAGASAGDVEPAKRLVEAAEGASVERDDGTGVSVPRDALAADVEISVSEADAAVDAQAKQAKKLEKRAQAASDEIEYGPEGTRFTKPVRLTVAYSPAPGLDEKSLKIHYWNPVAKDWEALDSVVDERAKTVSALTTHFSVYQVQGAGSGFVVAAAVDEFGLRDRYAFPNPSRGGAAVTFRVQPGRADSLQLRVYDVAGRKVHESSNFTLQTAFDDGNGKGPQHTYDHVWNVSGVGSGVYSFVIVVKKAGARDIIARGKAGVIK